MKYILLITLAIFSFQAFGQSIVTDRPDQTESSSTVGKGNLQFETGISLTLEDDKMIESRSIAFPSSLFRYGITNGIELRIGSQYEMINTLKKSYDGIADLEVGVKLQLLQNESSPLEIAFLSHLAIPTGSFAMNADSYGTINKLAISHDVTETIGFGYNVGYNYFGKGNGDLTYSMAVGVGVNDKVGVYIEPYGELQEFEDFVINMDAGFTYLVSENFQLDFSFGTGLNNRMNYIAAGFSWRALSGKSS